MLTAALPRLPARPGVRWLPSVPALVELMLVVAAVALLWPSFERVAQLGGAGRDQRFLDRGIAVAGLPDAVVPAACESVGALAEAARRRCAVRIAKEGLGAAAEPPAGRRRPGDRARERGVPASASRCRAARARAARAGRKRRRRAARAGRCDRRDRIRHRAVPAALPDRERRRRRSAAAALRGALGRRRARGARCRPTPQAAHGVDGARQRGAPSRRRARRSCRHRAAGRRRRCCRRRRRAARRAEARASRSPRPRR